MFNPNPNFARLAGNYLFSEIARKVAAHKESHPQADIIRLGIGDVTLPLPPTVVEAMHRAADEMGKTETFRGYGPEQGYNFLIEKIIERDYTRRGVSIDPDELFVSDGSKCDVANIQELFSSGTKIAICDPVYPVYRDSNIMAGRFDDLVYLPCRAENGFAPELPETDVDVIYLCSPNNPTGTVMSREALGKFIDYARAHGSLICFDSAYESYIRDPELYHSIYELPGAKETAIEFRSFSKTAGFTGVRCAYCVVPKALGRNLNAMWRRRQTTKFNGVSYVVQRAAEAACSNAGRAQLEKNIDYYMRNARLIRDGLSGAGMTVYGGEHAPYIWWKLPDDSLSSMEFFDLLLEKCSVVGTPGSGFGKFGEGYFRLTAFGQYERTAEAVNRIAETLK